MKSVFNFIILILFLALLLLRFGETGGLIALLFVTFALLPFFIVLWFRFLITTLVIVILNMYGLTLKKDSFFYKEGLAIMKFIERKRNGRRNKRNEKVNKDI